MAKPSRDTPPKELQRLMRPSKHYFFIDGKMVKFLKANKAANIVYLHNIIDNKPQTMLYSDFRKHRKRAFNVMSTSHIFDRGIAQMYRYINKGLIKPPTSMAPGGVRAWSKKSYFCEDDLFELRDALSHVPSHRWVLTEQELRARLGETLMLYTLNEAGQYVPVWSEDTY